MDVGIGGVGGLKPATLAGAAEALDGVGTADHGDNDAAVAGLLGAVNDKESAVMDAGAYH